VVGAGISVAIVAVKIGVAVFKISNVTVYALLCVQEMPALQTFVLFTG
jgi:hypothetical protein